MTDKLSLAAREQMIDALATYFSGSPVAAASIGLQLGGHSKVLADAFFKVRMQLGIHGYADRSEAAACLRALATDENKEGGE